MLIIHNKRHNFMAKALFDHNQSTDTYRLFFCIRKNMQLYYADSLLYSYPRILYNEDTKNGTTTNEKEFGGNENEEEKCEEEQQQEVP